MRELRPDVLLLGGLLCNDRLLLALRVLELQAVTLNRRLRLGHLGDDVPVLCRGRVDRLHVLDEVVEARRSKQHRERRVLLARRVRGDEPLRQFLLRPFQARDRHVQLDLVVAEVAADLVQPHVGEVVRLDCCVQVLVDLVDLTKDLLRLRFLRADRPRVACCTDRREKGHQADDEERLKLSYPVSRHQQGLWADDARRLNSARTSSAP